MANFTFLSEMVGNRVFVCAELCDGNAVEEIFVLLLSLSLSLSAFPPVFFSVFFRGKGGN